MNTITWRQLRERLDFAQSEYCDYVFAHKNKSNDSLPEPNLEEQGKLYNAVMIAQEALKAYEEVRSKRKLL